MTIKSKSVYTKSVLPMKKIIRLYLVQLLSLYFLTLIISGIDLEKGYYSLFIAALALSAAAYIVKPIINLLILPLNLITFGLFRWLSSAIALYLVTLVVPDFKISGFYFTGYQSPWFDIPVISLEGLLAFIAFSLAISIITSVLHWLLK